MKNISIFICCYVILMTSCTSSNKKTEETKDTMDTPTAIFPEDTQGISEVITRFTRAYLSQDKEKANALIHPDLGLYVIYRPGAADTYEKLDSIDFSRPTPEYFPYVTFENDYALTFEKLPVFDCGEEKWDKLGFFCDTTSQANQLTTIATFDHEFNGISDDELTEIKQLEKDTFRVILTKDENLIFHVKKYQDKWYVFVLDRAYGGCDA
ncbi:hypothetical protein [Sphingobacterium chuzhouense]|uniref:Beta-lactamase-inhibitor-like PepSY-like domain-containing protein n=1 Tax=Sphingobacterium chuzhouense TaxID=1742264 RepID=A0ABR7XPD7_9SPHI|nr:hypothetical protein [Sphingobacterium chuzhouense]MBD1421026.1 hypothetical protein [Sphingobacterium chuzhouense]